MRCVLVILLCLLPVCSWANDSYERALFYRGWTDADRDCMDLRHELLVRSAVFVAEYDEGGCKVLRGLWRDPYTGQTLRDPTDIDIDHLIPLRWAWDHGASKWSDEDRRRFALDDRFLIPVLDRANRSKGSKGPLDWLPMNAAERCGYVSRFRRGLLSYDFVLSDDEAARLRELSDAVCGP